MRGVFDKYLEEIKSSSEIILEIRFGEGGEDSKLFSYDLFKLYEKYACKKGLSFEVIHHDYGHYIAKIKGKNAGLLFWKENGQSVIQRIPPTETKGRKQTSYVIVGVLPIKQDYVCKPLSEKDLEIKQVRLSGPGGQNKNKCQNGVRIKHIPTGFVVTVDGRDFQVNKKQAIEILTVKVNDLEREKIDSSYANFKKSYMGSGSRGDKIRTYNILENRCVDHRTGVKIKNVKEVLEKANFDVFLRE